MTTLQHERSELRPLPIGPVVPRARGGWLPAGRLIWPYALILVCAAFLAYTNLASAPAFQNDEGVYTYQARSIFGGALAPYSYWYDHPPFGWIQLAAFGWIPKLFGLGGNAVASMRYVVASYLVLNAVLLYALARRVGLRQVFALVCAALFVLSPISLELGRQVLLDNLAMPWILAAFLLALSPSRNLLAHVGAGACFALGVLSKETMALYGPVLLYLLWRNCHHQTRAFSLLGFLSVGGLLISFYPLMALLKGELLPRQGRSTLADALLFQFVGRRGSGYPWQSGSVRNELIHGWLLLDGHLLSAGITAAVLVVLIPRIRWIGLAVGLFLLPLVASQGYLPKMYVVSGLPFLALAVGAAADALWSRRAARPGWWRRPMLAATGVVMVAALGAMALPNWQQHDVATLARLENSEYVQTVNWLTGNLSRSAVVVVPPSMWQDLRDAGWANEWAVIATEKVDLDPLAFARAHPGGRKELDYIVVNEQVKSDVTYLGLTQLDQALQGATAVATFGSTRVMKVRR